MIPPVLRRWVSVLDWLPGYKRADLRADVVAGVTGAAILAPHAMAFAQIAKLPPVVGLYAAVTPHLVYSLLGRTPQFAIGPLASISILSAVGVAKLAPSGSAQFIALSATLALLVGIVHLVIAFGRLSFVVRFLSEPVMAGFLAAVAVLVISTQLAALTGVTLSGPTGSIFDTVGDFVRDLDTGSVATVAFGLGSIALLVILRRVRNVPGPLVLVAVASLAVVLFDLDDHGIAVVGTVPSGLAGPSAPPLGWHEVQTLLPVAFAITMISLLEAMSLGHTYADKHGREVMADQEIAAIGASNVTAGIFQAMPVTSAIAQTAVLDRVGARTQLTGVIAPALIGLLLVFGAGLLDYVPIPALAAIVVVAVVEFIKVAEVRRLWRVQRADCWVLLATFAGTIVLGLELGVLVAVGTSVALVVYRVVRPRFPELGRAAGADAFVELDGHDTARPAPGVAIVRVEAPLYFVNAPSLDARVRAIERDRPDVRTLVLDCGGVNFLDATADHALRKLAGRLREAGIGLLLVNVEDGVRAVMDASGFTALVGEDAFFASDADALGSLGVT